jgi:hypothetical protein
MTTPPAAAESGAILSQILLKQGEMGIQLAVISEQLKAVPDHENRLRALETARSKMLGACIGISVVISTLGTWIGFIVHR